MLRKSTVFTLLAALITIAAVVGGFASFQRKRSSFERLDFRFHRDDGAIVVERVDPDSNAARAGLRPGDRIWVIAGVPSGEVEGVRKTLRRTGSAALLVARGSGVFTLAYVAPELKVDYRYLFLTFIGFLYLAIGLFTAFRADRDESQLFFWVTLLAFIVYVYSPAGDVDTIYKVLYIVEDMARIFLPPLSLHFFLRFPQPLLGRRKRDLALVYFVPVLLALWSIDLFVFDNAVRIASDATSIVVLDRVEMLSFALYFTLAFVVLTWTFRTANAAGQKKQIKWIYLGVGVGFIPFLILYLIPFILHGAGSAYTTIAILPLAFIPLAFAVSILKYKLWDVEVVIKEILAYTVTFVFGMIAFSTVNLLLTQVVEERLAMERNFLAFVSGLAIAGVLIPVKGRIESVIEMVLYRDTYRHRKAMADFARELATFYDLGELIDMIRQRLSAAIHMQKLNVYFREGDSFVVYDEDRGVPTELRADEAEKLAERRVAALDQPRLPEQSDLPERLLKSGYRYVFPLRHRNELQGILLCSTKRSDEPLSRDDLQLIGSLTAPVALAIENARLYSRLRRQLEEIQALKDYNENIIESSLSAIVVVSGDGTILTGNHAFWDIVGVTPETDKTLQELFPPFMQIRSASRGSIETDFTDANGVQHSVTVTVSPFASTGADDAKVIVIGDITERVNLERELREKERLASLGLLAAGIAHEVNTPLTGISSYAQMLLADTDPNDPRYALLRKMEQQSFRASHLVNNLLDFAANRRRSSDKVDLREVVRATLSLHEDLLKAKGVSVTWTPPAHDAVVMGNFYELQQVLTNLLLNARDAVDAGGRITIEVATHGNRAIMTVGDNGCGVAPELMSRIFQPLVTTKKNRGGTGLGLAITERIVRALGGEIRVESAPGAGATFFVELPLCSVEAQPV